MNTWAEKSRTSDRGAATHNPAHAAAVAEIETITADYCKGAAERSSADVDLLPPTSTPLDRAAGMMMLADARRSIAHCYQITGVPLGILSVGEQTWWARLPHTMRRTHLEAYFNLPRGS